MDINDQLKSLKQDILDLYVKRKLEVQYDKIGQLENKIAKKLEFWQELSFREKESEKS